MNEEAEEIDVDKEFAPNTSDSEVSSFDDDLLYKPFEEENTQNLSNQPQNTDKDASLHEHSRIPDEEVIQGLQPEDWIDGDPQIESSFQDTELVENPKNNDRAEISRPDSNIKLGNS